MNATEASSIGTIIRSARMARQLSVKELGKKNNISEQFIHSLENDQYLQLPAKVYSISLAEDILEHLGFRGEEADKILQTLELKLNEVEQEKYELLKNENYTPKTSKFSFYHTTQNLQSPPPSLQPTAPPTASPTAPLAAAGSPSASTTTSNEPSPPAAASSPADEKTGGNALITGLWATLSVILFGVIAVVLWFFVIQPKGLALETLEQDSYEARLQVFSLYGRSQTFEMVEGDQLRIFFSNTIVFLSLKAVADEQLSFVTSDGNRYQFELHDRHFVNLDDHGENDILLKYQKRSGDLAVVFVENLLFNETQVNYDQIWNNQERILIGRNYTLLESQIKIPIIVYVKAVSLPVHLSYNIDGRRQNTVNLATGTSLVISADEHLELQIGNYLSSALIINNVPINLFLEEYNRYSTTKIIKWLADYDNETLFDLVITDYVN